MADRNLFACVAVRPKLDAVIYVQQHLSDRQSDVGANVLIKAQGQIYFYFSLPCG
jgi:hypothetical protein